MVNRRIRLNVVMLTTFFAASPLTLVAQGAAQDPPATHGQTAEFANGRSIIFYREQKLHGQDLAVRITGEYKSADPEYKKAHELYDTAYEKYNAYLGQALLDVANGQKEDLTQAATAASTAATAFDQYVASVTKTKSITADFSTVSQLVQAAVGLYDFFVNRQKKQRQDLVKQLTPDLTWGSWATITSGSTQPSKPAEAPKTN